MRVLLLLSVCCLLLVVACAAQAVITIGASEAVAPTSSDPGDGLTSGYKADPSNHVITLAEADTLILVARVNGTLDVRTIPNINVDLRGSGSTNPFGPYLIDYDYEALQFNGYINIKAAGDYKFGAAVDDGFRLRIAGQSICWLDNGHWFDWTASDVVHFEAAGIYPVDITYYNGPYCCYGFRLGAIGPSGSGLVAYSETFNFGTDLGTHASGGHPGTSVIPQSLFFTTRQVKIGVARQYVDGAQVRLNGVVVTAAGGPLPAGIMYVEEEDRSAGIRVRVPTVRALGDRVQIDGVLTTQGAERMVLGTAQVISSGNPLPAVGMNNRALGGKGTPPVPDVTGSDLYNVGLRVIVWGRVSGATTGAFEIDDGTVRKTKVLAPGITPLPADDAYIKVTGISGAEQSGPGAAPVIRLISAGDWKPLP